MSEFKVDIKANLLVDKDTADLSLRLVNLYCNQNRKRIADEIISHDSDELRLSFADKHKGCEDCDEQVPRDYVCYTNRGKEKVMNYCPTCGRRVRY